MCVHLQVQMTSCHIGVAEELHVEHRDGAVQPAHRRGVGRALQGHV